MNLHLFEVHIGNKAGRSKETNSDDPKETLLEKPTLKKEVIKKASNKDDTSLWLMDLMEGLDMFYVKEDE